MKVRVYWNLHKKCYSVQYQGKVVLHCKDVKLKNVKFTVRKAGQRKVRETKRKNVHAFVEGDMYECVLLESNVEILTNSIVYSTNVKYNPYENDTFVGHVANETWALTGAKWVWLGIGAFDSKPFIMARGIEGCKISD